jgi:CRISPR-associated protein Cmr6
VRQAIIKLADRRGRGSHPGLILQRYLTNQAPTREEERRALFDATLQAAQSDSLRSMYSEAFARWGRSFPQGRAHRSEQLTTIGRLVVGLGSETVLEVGLRLHHTFGVPIIPGSALKGLASHYCHDVWGQRCNDETPEENRLFRRGGTHHSLLFGTTDDGGLITFHDAWVTPASLIDAAQRHDVMTPHHPTWQTNEAPPTDFDSPVPVSFLSVAGTFDVRLSWSGPASTPPDQAEAWATLAMKLLQEALAEWGVGGKTSSGYGRLVPSDSLRSDRQPSSVARVKQVAPPTPGEIVNAQLLEERTKRGGWKALHEPSGLAGPIQNSGDVPADKNVGDTLKLVIASANERELAFRYPTPADEERAQRAPSKGKGHGGSGRGGRR